MARLPVMPSSEAYLLMPLDMLPAWLVPGPTLPSLDGLALVPDFMLAPVVVCDDIE